MPIPDELIICIEGPSSAAKSHLAENLYDILLAYGFMVAMDPEHGFSTPAKFRSVAGDTPPIRIIEYDEAVEGEIEVAERMGRVQ